ncbi:MAG: DUF4157 domain-containing protein [Synechococcales bacterium]|nr:DUF4157 domain-containing protein [Synechococcales bacterium]
MRSHRQTHRQSRQPQESQSSSVSANFARPFTVPQAASASEASPADLQAKQTQERLFDQAMMGLTMQPTPPPMPLQRKVTIGQPNDAYEQEADQVASQVMGMTEAPTPVQRQTEEPEEEEIHRKAIASTITPFIQRETISSEEEETLQTKQLIQRDTIPEEEEPVQAKAASTSAASGRFESNLTASRSGGAPLPETVRSFMEPRFGADFSGVRVHTGAEAVQMSQAIGAQAFTHGQDVYYGAGKAPGNDELTAHELTHVVQQTGNAIAIQRDTSGNAPASEPAPINWNQRIRQLDRMTPAQRRAELLRIQARGEWSALLSAIGDRQTPTIQRWLNQEVGDGQAVSLEDRIRTAHNSDRGQQALTLIDAAIANRDPRHRITPRLRELLALGVALPKLDQQRAPTAADLLLRLLGITPPPQQDENSLTQEGVLTIAQVEQAVNALIWMPRREYSRLSLLLAATGDRSRLTQSFLLLEATAARASRFDPANAATRANPGNLRELERFARAIRNLEQRDLIEQTSAAQTTAGSSGLTQKFTDSCGPTSAQLIRAEADPIEAFRMHQQGELGQDDLNNATAREQEASLERHSGQTATPRGRATIITNITNALPGSGCTARQQQAVLNYVNGVAFSATHFAIGIAKLERSMGANFPGATALRMVRESAAGPGATPGLTPGELTGEANGPLDVDARTGRSWQDSFDGQLWTLFLAAGRQITSVNMAAWNGRVTTLLNQAAPLVERGNDVAFIVYWHGGGGHFMTFTDVRTVAGVRRFLVHDPWTGTTQWMSQATILAGGPWPPGGNGLLCGLQG